MRRGKVARNVCKLIDAPRGAEMEIEPLGEHEARRILDLTAKRRNGARWSVALALGLRQCEALGLRWKYVDLDSETMRVHWQIKRRGFKHGCEDSHACVTRYHRTAVPEEMRYV